MFSFTFLNSGILILTIASVIPILIHLFAKKKPKKIIFSSIKFIKLSQQQQNKKINLKNLILLLLRILIILFTILAISRPALKLPFLKGNTNHPKTAIAIIIDNSYSMDYLVDTKTELEKAKEIVSEISEILSDDDISLIMTMNNDWNKANSYLVYGKPQENIYRNIEITAIKTDLSDLILSAEKKLNESQIINKEIYVISDLQENSFNKKIETPLFFIPSSGINSRNNISCQNAHPVFELVDRSVEQKIEFSVINHSSVNAQDVICQLILDGKTISEKVIELTPNQKKTAFFKLNLETSGWHSGFINAKNERLPFDNKSYFSFHYKLSPEIAIVTDNPILPISLQSLLEVFSGDQGNISFFGENSLNYENIEKMDLVIIHQKEFSNKTRFVLDKMSREKRPYLFIADRNLSQKWNPFLADEFNISLKEFQSKGVHTNLSYINKYHNITKLLELKKLKNLSISDYWSSSDINKESISLIETNGYPLSICNENNHLWLFDPASIKNEFLLHSSFPVFAYRLFQDISMEKIDNRNIIAGTSYKFDSDSILLPDGNEIVLRDNRILLNKIGIYQTISSKKEIISVNLNYTESEFKRIDTKMKGSGKILSEKWKDQILQSRYGFEVWKILLIFVLIFFALEMFIVKMEEKNSVN